MFCVHLWNSRFDLIIFVIYQKKICNFIWCAVTWLMRFQIWHLLYLIEIYLTGRFGICPSLTERNPHDAVSMGVHCRDEQSIGVTQGPVYFDVIIRGRCIVEPICHTIIWRTVGRAATGDRTHRWPYRTRRWHAWWPGLTDRKHVVGRRGPAHVACDECAPCYQLVSVDRPTAAI